jgi:hypothetical protein
VKETARAFSKGSVDQFGRIRASDWRLPRFDIRVTPTGMERALQFMDGLVKLLEANGAGVKTGADQGETITGLLVDGELIRVKLTEAVRGRKRDLTIEERSNHERYPDIYRRTFGYAYDPADRFVFQIECFSDAQRTWADTKRGKIEECTERIVFGLRAAAASEKRWRVEREAERQRSEREQRLRIKQQVRIDRLKSNLAKWEEAQRIRAYLAAVRMNASRQEGGLTDESLISRFLAWADRYVDSLDPTGAPAALDWAEDA